MDRNSMQKQLEFNIWISSYTAAYYSSAVVGKLFPDSDLKHLIAIIKF